MNPLKTFFCFFSPKGESTQREIGVKGWGGILLFLFLFPSCVDTLEIDSKDIKPKIVLNGIIEADSTITVKISKTYPFTNDYYNNPGYAQNVSPEDKIIPNLLPHAKAKLYINGKETDNLRFIKNDSANWSNGSIFQSNYRPKIGDKIRIEVSAPDFETVWAETIIPQPILIHQVDTATFIKNTENMEPNNFQVPKDAQSLNLSLGVFVENSDKKNSGFYSFEIYQEFVENKGTEFEFLYRKELKINKDKELLFSNKAEDELLRFFLEKGNQQSIYYFTDRSFTNKKYKINISVWGYYFHRQYDPDYHAKPEIHDEPLNIEITSLSPELYQAIYENYSEMDYYIKLLSEPKTTFSNVHNGAGILGALSKTKKVIEIPKYSGDY